MPVATLLERASCFKIKVNFKTLVLFYLVAIICVKVGRHGNYCEPRRSNSVSDANNMIRGNFKAKYQSSEQWTI